MDATKNLLEAVEYENIGNLKTQLIADPKILQKFSLVPRRDTPLHVAASVGNLELVELIIEKKPSFAWDKNKYGLTPLHIASALGHLEIVKTLLGVGSESTLLGVGSESTLLGVGSEGLCRLQDDQGRTPLHYAAMNGETDVSRRLAKECPETLATLTTDKDTPLLLALKNKKQGTIDALVEELGCFEKFIFKRRFLVNQRKIFYFQSEGSQVRLGLGRLRITLTSRTDKKSLQVVATLVATVSFEAIANIPEYIWKPGMKLNYKCITAKTLFTSTPYCPNPSYVFFLLSTTACFVFSSLVLLTFREGVVAEFLHRGSLILLVVSYFLLLQSMNPKEHTLIFTTNSVFIIVYFVLLLDWLRMKVYWYTKPKERDQQHAASMNAD